MADIENLGDYMAQLADFKKAKLAPLMKKLEKAQAELAEKQKEVDDLQAVVDRIEGVDSAPIRGKAKGSKSKGAPFSGDVAAVLKFIKANEGEDGVSTRALTAEFGKPSDGWETFLDSKASKKGEGAAGRWKSK